MPKKGFSVSAYLNKIVNKLHKLISAILFRGLCWRKINLDLALTCPLLIDRVVPSIYITFMTNNVYSNDDPDAWSLIGNLHLAKMEWGPAQVVTDINWKWLV